MRAAVLLLIVACSSPPSAAPAGRTPRPARAQAASAEDAPCSSDADCSITRVPAGGCCPILCEPRVVTARRAAELEANLASCNKGRECPMPACAPPRSESVPACENGRCVGRQIPMQ